MTVSKKKNNNMVNILTLLCLLLCIPGVVFGKNINGFYLSTSASYFKASVNHTITFKDVGIINHTHTYEQPILNYKVGMKRNKNNFGISFSHNLMNLMNTEKTIVFSNGNETLRDEKWLATLGCFFEYNREVLNFNEFFLAFIGLQAGYSGFQLHYNAWDSDGNCSLYNHYSIFGELNTKILIGFKWMYLYTCYSLSIGKRDMIYSSSFGLGSEANWKSITTKPLVLPRINLGLEVRI